MSEDACVGPRSLSVWERRADPAIGDLLKAATDGAVVGSEVEAALLELHGAQEIDHCGADFVRSFLLRPVAASLEHDGTAQLRCEVR
jgi:hypothetical protein